MRGLLVIAVALLVLLSGCINLGPDYVRPDFPVAESYMDADLQDSTIAALRWWDIFNDPVLQELISTAIEENRNLRAAVPFRPTPSQSRNCAPQTSNARCKIQSADVFRHACTRHRGPTSP